MFTCSELQCKHARLGAPKLSAMKRHCDVFSSRQFLKNCYYFFTFTWVSQKNQRNIRESTLGRRTQSRSFAWKESVASQGGFHPPPRCWGYWDGMTVALCWGSASRPMTSPLPVIHVLLLPNPHVGGGSMAIFSSSFQAPGVLIPICGPRCLAQCYEKVSAKSIFVKCVK